jgi:hypothetical protein
LVSKGRTQGWHGPALNVKGIFEKGANYEIKGYVKRANPTDTPSTMIMAMVDKSVGVTLLAIIGLLIIPQQMASG